jgi:hypothetical protein
LLTWSLSHDPRTSREKNDRFAAAGGWVVEAGGAKGNDRFAAAGGWVVEAGGAKGNDRFAAAGGWVVETAGAKKNDLFGADWVADHERMGDHGEIR